MQTASAAPCNKRIPVFDVHSVFLRAGVQRGRVREVGLQHLRGF